MNIVLDWSNHRIFEEKENDLYKKGIQYENLSKVISFTKGQFTGIPLIPYNFGEKNVVWLQSKWSVSETLL